MNPDFHPIVNGAYLLLAIQLVVVAALQFFYSDKKQYALAFLCLIMSMWFFRRFFWDVWYKYPILIVLIGGYKEVFIGPLFFFHLRMKRRAIKCKEIGLHLILPSLFYLRYIISRIFFPEFYNETKLIGFWSLFLFVQVSYLLYFILGTIELKKHLKPILISKVYNRTKMFFYIVLGNYLFYQTISLLSQIAVRLKPESEFWQYLNGTIIYKYDWYIKTPLLLIITLLVIVYALSETSYFKKLFLNKNIHKDFSPKSIPLQVSEKISQKFYTEKIYLNSKLKLSSVLHELDLNKKEFSNFLDQKGYKNFSEFINKLRVDEFKLLVHNKTHEKYDLLSIAKMSGFNSKATFNRIFKKFEGVTPKQYIKKNTSS